MTRRDTLKLALLKAGVYVVPVVSPVFAVPQQPLSGGGNVADRLVRD